MADTYSTTVKVNGDTIYSSRYTLGGCCCNNMYTMNSCFGFGYSGIGCGIGMGLGMAAGAFLMSPVGISACGKFFSWLGKSVIAPAATFAWNNVLKPVGNAVWSGIKWVGNTVAKGACAVAKGVKNLWNNIFHKKSKTKSEESQKA